MSKFFFICRDVLGNPLIVQSDQDERKREKEIRDNYSFSAVIGPYFSVKEAIQMIEKWTS